MNDQRTKLVARRLDEALDRPLRDPTSTNLARLVLGRFGSTDMFSAFAEKAIETLEDGQRHDRMAVSAAKPRVAVIFIAWSGSHGELQAERFGTYFSSFAATARRLVDAGVELAGFLEIDAYMQSEGRDDFDVDIECSYLPGLLLGFDPDRDNPLPNVVLLNPDLCTSEELQRLRIARG